jgi:predicted DCC family thiol-disulfide oxidoreductase YuxK
MKDKKKNILLFDGVCNLCNGAVQFILKRDKKKIFQFASLQSEAGERLLRQYGLSTTAFHSLVLIQDDHVFLKSTAVLKIAKQLGGFCKLWYAFIIIPRFIRDFIYDLVARSRYRIFGKRDRCMIPTADVSDRFISA